MCMRSTQSRLNTSKLVTSSTNLTDPPVDMAETDRLISFASPDDAGATPSSLHTGINKNDREIVYNNGILSSNHYPPQTSNVNKEETVEGDHVVYKGRWFILAVFSLLCCLQATAWNTWGPIADTAKIVLNWTDGDVALLANWGPIAFVITGFIFSYLLLVKGLRFCVLCSALIFLLGLGIRCLPVGIEYLKWTMNLGHICIGLGGPVMMAAPTEVSAVWFPPHQRTTSTAISSTAAFLGMAMSFLIGPLVVTSIPPNASSSGEPLDPTMRTHYFNEIMELMYLECGVAAIVVIATLLYFPDKPPTSPSLTATKPRDNFKDGVLKMIKSVHFWIPAAAYSITSGVFGGWNTQLDTIFQNTLNVGQETVGWIGFFSNIAAVIGGLVIARLVDLIGGRMKAILILLTAGSCLSCLWCVLLSMRYIPYSLASLYIACISIGVCVNASVPIYFEITVEGMYPVSESSITMVMTYLNNVAALVFLLLPLIPNIGVIWMNWLLLGSGVVCLPLLMMYKEHYNRMDEDLTESMQQG